MNVRRIAHSLVTRLIVFGILIVIAGGAIRYALLSQYLRDDLIQVVSAQQSALAEAIARDVDYKIEERRHMLAQMAVTLPQELLPYPERLRDWLQQRHELQPLFSLGLIVADNNGTILVDFPPMPGRVGVSVAGNPDFQAARAGQAVTGRPLLGIVSQQPILPMGAPVKDAAGKVRAVLIGTTALAAPGFLDRLQQDRIGHSGSFLLISPQDHLFVAASDPAMVLQPTPPAGVNALHDRAMAGFRGSGVTINAKGVEEIAAMVSVPSTGWFVVARLPSAEALASVGRAQGYVIRHSLTAIVVVSLVVGFLFTWLLRPLYRAADQADRMTQGEIPLTPLPVLRDDEVGHLTTAFNRLLSKLASSQAELQRMAHHDALTGLPNRNLLADRMQQALSRARRDGTRIALLFLDVDGFKPINDTLGHKAGDEALQEIVRRLMAIVRRSDTLARVGGDEFVLLATDLEERPEEAARTLARKCIEAVAAPLQLPDGIRRVGVSVGIALGGGACSPDQLLVAADQAMYEAKLNNRGGYVLAPCCDAPATVRTARP